VIEAAFNDAGLEDLRATLDAAQQAVEQVQAIDALVKAKVGEGHAIDFSRLRATLGEVRKQAEGYLVKRGAMAPSANGDDGDTMTALQANRGTGGAGGGVAVGPIQSTHDVIRALEAVCKFYELNEPSSPIPLIIRRAQRLVSKNFVEIIKDLSPDAIGQLSVISGQDLAG